MKRLLEFWRMLNLPCRDMAALYSRAQDTQLTRGERFAARLHLLYCTACRRYVKHMRLLRSALRRAAGELEARTNIRLSTAARERIGRVLDKGR